MHIAIKNNKDNKIGFILYIYIKIYYSNGTQNDIIIYFTLLEFISFINFSAYDALFYFKIINTYNYKFSKTFCILDSSLFIILSNS